MKSNLFTIIKKELARFFKDQRMVFTTVLMPGLLIYVMYSFMGNGFSDTFEVKDDTVYQIDTVNLPQSMAGLKQIENMQIEEIGMADAEDTKAKLEEGDEVDLLMIFPEDFDEAVAAYDVTSSAQAAPNIEIYYNSSETESDHIFGTMLAFLDEAESAMANKFDVDAGEKQYDLAKDEDITAKLFAMLLPMLVMIFLVSGCLAIASESIAGEKERGTIATLLVTPLKRRELALGKLLALSMIGLLSGCSSFFGTILSLPKLLGSEVEVSLAYTAADYLWLLLTILFTTLVIVGVISVLSAMAKTVKEAATYVMPFMMLVMIVAITSMLGGGAAEEWYFYLIPIYNSVQCMTGIFSMDYHMISILLTSLSNLVVMGLCVALLTKMFDSERIMYNQ